MHTEYDDAELFSRLMGELRRRARLKQVELARLAGVGVATVNALENLHTTQGKPAISVPQMLPVLKELGINQTEALGLMSLLSIAPSELESVIDREFYPAPFDEPSERPRSTEAARVELMRQLLERAAPNGEIRAEGKLFTADPKGAYGSDRALHEQLMEPGLIRSWTALPSTLVVSAESARAFETERASHDGVQAWPPQARELYAKRVVAFESKLAGHGAKTLHSVRSLEEYVGADQVYPRGPWMLNRADRRLHLRDLASFVASHERFHFGLADEPPAMEVHIGGTRSVILRPGARFVPRERTTRYGQIGGVGSLEFTEAAGFSVVLECLADFEIAWSAPSTKRTDREGRDAIAAALLELADGRKDWAKSLGLQ